MTERSIQHATIEIDRVFAAEPARLFRAWADPAERALWETPGSGWTTEPVERDFRVGAREIARFGPPGGPMFTADSRYEDIVRDRRIVFSYTVDDGEGRRMSASLASVELLPVAGGTRLIFTEQAAFLDGGDNPADRRSGWTEMLDRLAMVVGETAART